MTEDEKVFKDPVHGYIYVHHPLIWNLINTREMQRLRRIRQLGTAYVTYPGGEHSRFSHSLGVYEVIRQVILAFERNNYDWCDEDNVLAMASGLLHDIGHGPFSHALEHVLGTRHELWSEQIILDSTTEVHRVLESYRPGFARETAEVIAKRHPNRLVVSLVSGQLDADRLDYLMRDSVMTGVDYGKFDLARIIRVMLPKDGHIAVKRSGVQTVEAYLLARYFMYWQVYFHPVSRAAEIILLAILRRVKDLWHETGELVSMTLPALGDLFTKPDISLDNYLLLDDNVLFSAMTLWMQSSDAILSDLSRRFLNRYLFKYIEYPHNEPKVFDALKKAAGRAGFDPRYYVWIDEIGTVYYDYYLGEDIQSGRSQPIMLWDNEQGLIEMSVVSRPIAAIASEPNRIQRLYFAEELMTDLDFSRILAVINEGRGA